MTAFVAAKKLVRETHVAAHAANGLKIHHCFWCAPKIKTRGKKRISRGERREKTHPETPRAHEHKKKREREREIEIGRVYNLYREKITGVRMLSRCVKLMYKSFFIYKIN